MKICDFTKPELDMLIDQCNFTVQELEYFNLKSKDISNVEISIKMNISESTVSKLAKKVKSKIFRVI